MHCNFKSVHIKVVILILSSLTAPSFAQVNSAKGPRLTMQGPAEQTSAPSLRDALGRPCLDVEAASRAHVVNRDMVDHIVSLKNNCLRQINARVCYYNTDRCKDIVLQAYKRADAILGTMRGVARFRYTITQK